MMQLVCLNVLYNSQQTMRQLQYIDQHRQHYCPIHHHMYESQQKREQFHKQIRQKHHEQIFRKIRSTATADNKQDITQQLQPVLNKLPEMYSLSSNIDKIMTNQGLIVQYIGEMRKFQDSHLIVGDGWGNDAFLKLLEYPLHVASVIHGHMMMDIQGCEIYEEQYAQKQALYGDILLPISYFLINLTSQQLPLTYLQVIAQYTKYRVFMDSFHNTFISENLTPKLKQELLDQFLEHLEKYSMFTLNNCNTFMKILYCGFINSPPMLGVEFKQYHIRAIRVMERLHSILEFSTKLTQPAKNQCRQYTWIILHKLCSKNQSNCCQAVNSVSVIKSIQNLMEQIRYLFITKGILNDDFCDETLVAGLSALVNLTYYDDVAYSLNQCFPTIWLHLLTIFQRLAIQTWILEGGKTILPAIFQTPNFTTIALKILKCISNFICVPQICEHFIASPQDNKKLPWFDILTQIYNNQYKCGQIRVECLCILSNALLIVSRQQNKSIYDEQDQDYCEEPPLCLGVLNGSVDLLMEVLKLHNTHKNIIISVLKTMVFIMEQNPKLVKKCHIFQNHSFMNRLTSIAENNIETTIQKQNKFEEYSEDVRLQAHYLLEAYMINQEKI